MPNGLDGFSVRTSDFDEGSQATSIGSPLLSSAKTDQ
jgi:hypothetical protein